MRKEKSLLFLEEWEKVKIQRIHDYTKDKDKHENINNHIKRISKHRTHYTASFRIATKYNYTHKNLHSKVLYNRIRNHNSRANNLKTDLTQLVNLDLSKAENQNQSKEYNKFDKSAFDRLDHLRDDLKSQKKEIYRQLKNLKRQLQRAENKEPRLKKPHKIQELKDKIQDLESKLQKLKLKKVPKKDAKLIQEVVINVRPDTEIKDIERALESVCKEIPIFARARLISIDIHRDEGYINQYTGQIEKNYHAHIVFNNIDKQTGRTIFRQITTYKGKDGKEYRNRDNLAKIRDILAQELGLEKAKRWEKRWDESKKRQVYVNNEKHKTKWQLKREYQESVKYLKDNLMAIDSQISLEQYEQANKEQKENKQISMQPYEAIDNILRTIENAPSENDDTHLDILCGKPQDLQQLTLEQMQQQMQELQRQFMEMNQQTQSSQQNITQNPIQPNISTPINTQKIESKTPQTAQTRADSNIDKPQSTLTTTQHAMPKESPRTQESHPAPAKSPAQDSNIPTKYADDLELAKLTKREKALNSLSADGYSFNEYISPLTKDNTLTEQEREAYKHRQTKFDEQDKQGKKIILQDFLNDEKPKVERMIKNRIAELEKAEALQLQKATKAHTQPTPAHAQSSQQNITQSTNAQQQGISNNKLTSSQPKTAQIQPTANKPKTPKKSQGQGRGM